MRLRANLRLSNQRISKRVRTEKEGWDSLMHDEDSSLGFNAKLRLNSFGAELAHLSSAPPTSKGPDDALAGWNHTALTHSQQDLEADILAVPAKQNKLIAAGPSRKKDLRSHVSLALHKRYTTQRSVDNITQMVLKESSNPEVQEESHLPQPKQPLPRSHKPKSLYIRKIDLVMKVKEEKCTGSLHLKSSHRMKPFSTSPLENKRNEYRLPRLERASMQQHFVPRSRRINFPYQSLLHDELCELNKLLCSESVSIKEKILT